MRYYRERLAAPLAWWLLAVPVIVLLGGQLYAGFGDFGDLTGVIAFAAFGVVYLAGLLALSAARIEVGDGRLTAGRATLPMACVAEVVPLNDRQFAALRGPRADPAAHLMLRPYLKRGVYVTVNDPGAAAPYWLIGSRHPVELAAAMQRCRADQTGDAAAKPGGRAGTQPTGAAGR